MDCIRDSNRFLTSVSASHSWAEEERVEVESLPVSTFSSLPGGGNGKFPILSGCSVLSPGDGLVLFWENSLGLELGFPSPELFVSFSEDESGSSLFFSSALF